jgi:hypothetical protein
LDREKPVSFCFLLLLFLFFFWSNALKKFRNLSRDDDDDDIIIIINKNSAISEEKILHLSFLSLSLSFNYLVPISAGIARVVKVKLARAQGVHDDVEDTELTGG